MSLSPAATSGNALQARPSTTSGVTSAQRAAVIIKLLGDSGAKPIVEKLDDRALAKVAAELENISYLSRDQLIEIVVDFLKQLRSSTGALRGGREMARDLMGAIVEPKRHEVLFGEVKFDEQIDFSTGYHGPDVWQRLTDANPDEVAEYLSGLTPNIIALILRRLDTSVSSKVLSLLSEEKLGPTLGQMVDAPQTDPGVFDVIGRMVEMEFLNATRAESEDDNAHLEAVGELLSLVPSDRRERLVLFLRNEHESKIEAIEGGMITIDLLPDILPRVSVPVVFREVDMAEITKVLVSLKGKHSSIIEFLLSNISSRMADQFREEVERAPAMSDTEVESVQREFLTTLMSMKRDGLITLDKPKPQDEP